MQTTLRFAVAVAALCLSVWNSVNAQTPTLHGEGKILLLDNGRAMEGDILRLGEKYRIRRKIGELWLPASRVKFVGKTWKDALTFMRSRANLSDVDERLRLARWCQSNNKYELALAEIKQALELHPNHGGAEYLLRTVQRSAEIARRPPVQPKSQKPLPPPPTLDLNAESTSEFVLRIQPLLMNSCARCHANGRGGKFQLKHVHSGAVGGRRSTMHNLAAVVGQIRVDNPALSPLMIKSVSAHGNAAKPPIKSRRSPPFKILEQWVENTLAGNPHIKELVLQSNSDSPRAVAAKGISDRPAKLFDSAAQRAVGASATRQDSPAAGSQTQVKSKSGGFATAQDQPRNPSHFPSQPRVLPKFTNPLTPVRPVKKNDDRSTPSAFPNIPVLPKTGSAAPAKQKPPQVRTVSFQSTAPPAASVRIADTQSSQSSNAPTTANGQSRQSNDPYNPARFNEQMHPKR